MWRRAPWPALCCAAFALLSGAASCYAPSFAEGLECTPDRRCPEGQACAADGRCYHSDEGQSCAPVESLVQRIEPQAQDSAHRFGSAVALSATTLVVTDPEADPSLPAQGAAYVFTGEGAELVRVQRLSPPDSDSDDRFGSAAALDPAGDVLVIGSAGDDPSPGVCTGSVYVYTRDGAEYTQRQKLVPTGGAQAPCGITGQGSNFGSTVSTDGDTIAVGANNEEAVYIFERAGDQWSQVARLDVIGMFEGQVFVAGDSLFIGAPENPGDDAMVAGTVFVYQRSDGQWQPVQSLRPVDIVEGDRFGASLSVAGDLLVAGAYGHPAHSSGQGAAYAFEQQDGLWREASPGALLADDGGVGDDLGQSAAILGAGSFAVGAPDRALIGSVYVFVRSAGAWQQHVVAPPDGAVGDDYGLSIAGAASRLAVGSPGSSNGAVYVYHRACE